MSAQAEPIHDPYNDQPELEEVPPERAETLMEQAREYHKKLAQMKQQPFFSQKHYYLLSTKWLKRWKQYVSYEEVISDRPPQKFFGCGRIPTLNKDIIEKNNFDVDFGGNDQHFNIKLRDGLREQVDFQFVDEGIWEVFDGYRRIQVLRRVVDTPDGNKVQLYYQPIVLSPLCMSSLKDIQNEHITKLPEVKFQFSRYATVAELCLAVEEPLSYWLKKDCYAQFPDKNFVKLWMMPEGTRKNILVNTLMQGTKANPSFSYKLFLDATLLDSDATVGELDLLQDTIVVAEVRQYRQNWCFFNLKHKLKAQCSYCKKETQLGFVCSCKYQVYCSRQCKSYDKSHHRMRCPNDAQSDEEEQELKLTENSRKGICGLRNLGNTCFMNSGLQCVSHIIELTEYFLSGKYEEDINVDNPLGTQGQLSREYAKMVKKLWLGEDSCFAPTHLKKSIAKFQPMFSGYNQHDSGELITYLLDGLHEDLNRIKKKPYTELKDYDGRPDQVIAKEVWQTFLMRNRSEIVDMLYGQFKSIVQCPNEQCKNISITFDPFSNVTLPLKDNSKKTLELIYLKDHIYSKKVYLTFSMDKDYTLEDMMGELRTLIGVDESKRLLIFVSSYSSCEPINIKEPINEIRREFSYRTLYVRELLQWQNPEQDIRVMIANVVNNSYYATETYRKNIIPYHLYYVNREITNKQFYHRIIGYYKRILGQFNTQQFGTTYIDVPEDKDEFRLLLIPFSRYYACTFCDKKNCNGCKLPYNEDLFRQYVKYNPKSEWERDKKIDIELYWRKDEKEVERIFEEIKEENTKTFGRDAGYNSAGGTYVKPVGGIPLNDCFALFEKEEVLNEENAWYCNKCQDFVLAKKQMKIYKAPKILILCLKRFKRKNYYSEKIGSLVDFPVEGLDLSEYVTNKELPNDCLRQMAPERPNILYDLIGISNHFGNTGGGHYTAYCKDPNSGDWYDFDDSCVQKLEHPEDIVSDSAYILFYKRRQ